MTYITETFEADFEKEEVKNPFELIGETLMELMERVETLEDELKKLAEMKKNL